MKSYLVLKINAKLADAYSQYTKCGTLIIAGILNSKAVYEYQKLEQVCKLTRVWIQDTNKSTVLKKK